MDNKPNVSVDDLTQETAYKIPANPVVEEHFYLHAAVIELRRLRASVDALTAAVIDSGATPQEVTLREPATKPKPKRGDP